MRNFIYDPRCTAERQEGCILFVLVRQVSKYIEKYIRVMKLLKKPNRDEFWAGVKIAGAGLLLVGLIGYVIWFILLHILHVGA